jgi:hypothetical protein
MGALIVLILACVTAEFFWWIVAITAAVVVFRWIFKAANAATDRELARASQRAALAARADQQHQWYIEGDQRGTHGLYPPAAVN